MKNLLFSYTFLKVFATLLLACVLISCQKDDQDGYNYPSSVNIQVGEGLEFDATENQVITVDADSFSFDFEILSLVNTLCPEGSRCVFTGYAILSLKPLVDNSETITLYYLYKDPDNLSISDSSRFNYEDKNFLIRLSGVKKVYINENGTQTKNVIDLEINLL